MTYGNSINYPSTIAMNRDALDYTKNILPMLWDVIERKQKYSPYLHKHC